METGRSQWGAEGTGQDGDRRQTSSHAPRPAEKVDRTGRCHGVYESVPAAAATGAAAAAVLLQRRSGPVHSPAPAPAAHHQRPGASDIVRPRWSAPRELHSI